MIFLKIRSHQTKIGSRKKGSRLHVTESGEKKWYKMAFANKYHAEDQSPWASPL